MKHNYTEGIVTLCLVVLAILILNPFYFWMPDMMVLGMLTLMLAVFAVFASFIVREGVVDERDGVHRTLAGRNAYLVGAAVLTLAIVVEGYTHSVDPWLVVALLAMITTKILTRWWSDRNG